MEPRLTFLSLVEGVELRVDGSATAVVAVAFSGSCLVWVCIKLDEHLQPLRGDAQGVVVVEGGDIDAVAANGKRFDAEFGEAVVDGGRAAHSPIVGVIDDD